jgi:hypothetical protein
LIVEVATFKLAAGTDEAAFLTADKAVQEELVPRRPGFVRRTTARGADGAWLVVALWRTMADAKATEEIAHSHPAGQAFAALLDQSTVDIRRYETID